MLVDALFLQLGYNATLVTVGACLLGLTFYLISVALEAITTHRRGSDLGGSTP